MESYYLDFKCKRCGEAIPGITKTPLRDVASALADAAEGKIVECYVSIHFCEDGGQGITEFVGYHVGEK